MHSQKSQNERSGSGVGVSTLGKKRKVWDFAPVLLTASRKVLTSSSNSSWDNSLFKDFSTTKSRNGFFFPSGSQSPDYSNYINNFFTFDLCLESELFFFLSDQVTRHVLDLVDDLSLIFAVLSPTEDEVEFVDYTEHS